jgi:hypothetical protein
LVPVLGFLFAFGAPVLALMAVVFGGVAMSRARQQGRDTGAGLAGVILGVLAFIPALVVALTCGACNACVSAGLLSPGAKGVRWGTSSGMVEPPAAKRPAKRSTTDAVPAKPARPRDPGSPPPAFPPPPFGPGPGSQNQSGGAPSGPAQPAAPGE